MKSRQLEQTDSFLLTPIVSSRQNSIQGARLFGQERDLVRSGKAVSMFLKPEAKLLGCMNKENLAIHPVAKPGMETGRNVETPLLGGVNRQIYSKTNGLDRVQKDHQLLEVRWCIEESSLDFFILFFILFYFF